MIDENRIRDLKEFELKLGIQFKDICLLHQSLIHSSYLNEIQTGKYEDNEKLELLGDSVYGFIVVDYLYKVLVDKDEGELSRIKSVIVSEDSFYNIAILLDFKQYLLLGRGEKSETPKKSLLADAFEAFIAAYYLDSGLEAVREFSLKFIKESVADSVKDRYLKDYKTKLQHIIQEKYKTCPIYKTLMEKGPDHKKTFLVQAFIEDKALGAGIGTSKKLAQQSAAHNTIELLESQESK